MIQGQKKACGHYCANPGKLCCRCTNPAHGEYWLPWNLVCPICRGTLFKHPDGCYTQACPICGTVNLTIDEGKGQWHGTPMLAPLAGCPSCMTLDDIPPKMRHKLKPALIQRLQRNALKPFNLNRRIVWIGACKYKIKEESILG